MMMQVKEKSVSKPNEQEQYIKQYTLQKQEQLQEIATCNRILFILSGSIRISIEKLTLMKVKQSHMLFIRAQSPCHITALENVVLMTVNTGDCIIDPEIISSSLNSPIREKTITKPQLKLTPLISHLVETLKASLSYDFQTAEYAHIKVQELFLLIAWYYSPLQISEFFWGNHISDRVFFTFVINCYKKANSIAQMAQMACYSKSGFDKRFRKVFNKSPGQWLRDRKAADIYNEICVGQKTFKQISYDYNFSSPAHLNDFCKAMLGGTPGELRRKSLAGQNTTLI